MSGYRVALFANRICRVAQLAKWTAYAVKCTRLFAAESRGGRLPTETFGLGGRRGCFEPIAPEVDRGLTGPAAERSAERGEIRIAEQEGNIGQA